jgi:hypothetical protein
MPHEVIDLVHRMARQQKANPGLVFADQNNVSEDPMDDSDDDSDNESYADSSEDDDDWSQPLREDGTDSNDDEPHGNGDDPSIDDNLDNLGDDEIDDVTEITQPCIHTCDGLFICQLYSLPDLLEETECKEDMPLTLPFASFVSLSQLIIVI